MSTDLDRFGTRGDTEEAAGKRAVVKRFGANVWARIENWPLIAREWGKAYGLDALECDQEAKRVERYVRRARMDPDYAVNQAEMIARSGYSREDLTMVRSAASIVKAQEAADEAGREKIRKYQRMHDGEKAGPAPAVPNAIDDAMHVLRGGTPDEDSRYQALALLDPDQEVDRRPPPMSDCSGAMIDYSGPEPTCTHCGRMILKDELV